MTELEFISEDILNSDPRYHKSNPDRICCVKDCGREGAHSGYKRKDGTIMRRAYCTSHHAIYRAKNKGLASAQEWYNSFHPYRKFRKDYCENVDGRLGFKCTTTIAWVGMLQVDHIDGNPTNNTEENMQTLCACCHVYKTWKEKDSKTPGRKELGVKW